MGKFKFKIDNEAKRIVNIIYKWDIATIGKLLEAGFEYDDKERWLKCEVELNHHDNWIVIIEPQDDLKYRIDIYNISDFDIETAHKDPGKHKFKLNVDEYLKILCWIDSKRRAYDIPKSFSEFKESIEIAYHGVTTPEEPQFPSDTNELGEQIIETNVISLPSPPKPRKVFGLF